MSLWQTSKLGSVSRPETTTHPSVLRHSSSSSSRQMAGTAGSKNMQRIEGLSDIMDTFQGVLLDQFGVLHDGRRPYPCAIAAVEALAAAGKTVLVLSNSSRRSGGTIGKLAGMGFQADWFSGAITSGELTHRYLSQRPTTWWQQLGTRCLHITWSSRGTISLDGLGLTVVSDPAQADFILAHGTEAIGRPGGGTSDQTLTQLQQLLEQCLQEQRRRQQGQQQGQQQGSIPMIVANPDLVTVDGPGSLITMPGTLARFYQQRGGVVQLMGKPDPLIYAAALELAGSSSASSSDWLAIGDSLEHDVAGAAAAGIRTLFIAGGIHAEELGLQGSPQQGNRAASWSQPALEQLCLGTAAPDFCMAFLQG